MTRAEVRARIEEVGIIAAVRVMSADDALFAAEAVAGGGISVIEIPVTIPDAVQLIAGLVRRNPGIVVGAGTLFDVDVARECLKAGAAFLTSTGLDFDVVALGREHGAVAIPGALTPTEVMAAYKAGADFVKIFPCSQVGGAHYIKTLKAPFPGVPLIASGGVNQQNLAEFFHAGAVAVGVGANLIHTEAIHRREPDWIKEISRRYLHLAQQARAPIARSTRS